MLKTILYKLFAPFLRFWLRNSIEGKRIKGTDKVLYYDRSQHLGFLGTHEIEYEREFSKVILQHILPGNLVFEIGSNIGQYSLQISEKLGSAGQLVCVEPDSDNFAMLSFNIKSNNCANVCLVNKAVSDREGKMTMYKDITTGGRMSSLFREYSGKGTQKKTEEVEVTTLKSLIDAYGIPSFIKVDVEGAEQLVFSDSKYIFNQTIYLVEVREETKAAIFDFFFNAGFQIFILERDSLNVSNASEIPDFANLLIKSAI